MSNSKKTNIENVKTALAAVATAVTPLVATKVVSALTRSDTTPSAAKSIVKAAIAGAALKATIELGKALVEGESKEELVKATKRGATGGVVAGTVIGAFSTLPILKDVPSTISSSLMATASGVGKAIYDGKTAKQIARFVLHGTLEVASAQLIKKTVTVKE